MRGIEDKETMNFVNFFYNDEVEVKLGEDPNEIHEDFNIMTE